MPTSNLADPGEPVDRRQALPVPALAEFARYLGVSLVALVIDAGGLLLLAHWMHYLVAASLSFVLGSAVHYLLSVRVVFARRRLAERPWMESGTFFGAGLVALAANGLVIYGAVEWFALPLLLAKLAAAGVSFFIGYGSRKWMLFT